MQVCQQCTLTPTRGACKVKCPVYHRPYASGSVQHITYISLYIYDVYVMYT